MGLAARRVVALAIVPLMALGTACSSDDDKKSDAQPGSSASVPAGNTAGTPTGKSASPPAGQSGAGAKPLTEEQLKAALITSADVPGYQVGMSTGGETAAPETSDKPECQPLLQFIASDTAHTPPVTAETGARKAGANDKVVTLIMLGQFDGDKARQFLTEAKEALPKCASFVGTDGGEKYEYTAKEGAKLGFGDDSFVVQFTMDDGFQTINLVRSGPVIIHAAAYTVGPDTMSAHVPVPESMLRAQYDKVAAAQKG